MKTHLTVAALLLVITGCSGQHSDEPATPVNLKSLAGDSKVTDIRPADSEASYPARSPLLSRNYAEQPPLIPHRADYPITASRNSCLGCHSWDKAPKTKATPIAKSHVIDDKGTLNGHNYFCTQCHVPQAENKQPIVDNSFQQ